MGEKQKRVAVYCRVSKLDQNPDLQFRELREYAKRRDWKITEFVDHGITGAEARRPRLAAMNEALFRHEYDAVLVWKFDRLFRSVHHIVEFLEKVRTLQIDFVSLTEQIDTMTPQGRLVFHVLAAIAEFERELIRERVMSGLAAAKARGKKLGRPKKKIDVARVLEDRRLGRSLNQIAREYGVSKTTVFGICHGIASDRRNR
ncbi:MAG TPA: recombinase family protein [Candidatus Acidoferrum sp.]|nr:recombinase family protein [Candidatus Acidoferrum sp.]